MGRVAASGRRHRYPPRCAELAKKALGIRPRPGADASPRMGKQAVGARGKARAAGQGRINWQATLLHGRPRQRDDLRWQLRGSAAHELWLVIVDASASTRRHGALSDAKGLLASLFDQAYRQRARLALLTASGTSPHWQRHGLKASAALTPWLQGLGAGGGTPLRAALDQAAGWLAKRRKSHAGEQQRCLILTDGRLKHCDGFTPLGCPSLLIDIEKGPIRFARAAQLAEQLGADYKHIETLPAQV
ncbi:MAG: VWA domain-containing protein [Pseudomonas sp.]|nr:VWA domain-containing protein [Pseudomonas sp.]